MAAQIEIRTNKGSFDLYQGVERDFYITRQIHDLNNFETRNADFTKTIQIPSTPNNIRLLDAYSGVTQSSVGVVPCQILMAGITIAPSAGLLFTKSVIKDGLVSYDVAILYGNFNVFNSIDANTLDSLNLADLAYSNVPSIYVQESENTEGLVTAIADWAGRGSYPLWRIPFLSDSIIEINIAGSFIYTKELVKRIINEAGYTLKIDQSVPDLYNKLALAIPVTQFFDLPSGDIVSYSSASKAVFVDQLIIGATERIIFTADAGDPLNEWNSPNNEWIIAESRELNIHIQGFYKIENNHPSPTPSNIILYQNGAPVQTLLLSAIDEPDLIKFFIGTAINAIVGDVIHAECTAQQGTAKDAEVTIGYSTSFILATPSSPELITVQPSRYIPQIGKPEFLMNILKLLNLVITTDDISKEVTIGSFNQIYSAPEQDLTKYLDVGHSDISKVKSMDSLGQNSWFKWKNDNLLRRDVDKVLRIDNQLFAKEKTIIDMIFSACDNSVSHFYSPDVHPKVKIPNASITHDSVEGFTITAASGGTFTINNEGLGFNVGDFFFVKIDEFVYTYMRVDVKTGDNSGVANNPVDDRVAGLTLPIVSIVKAKVITSEARLAVIHSDGNEDFYSAASGSSYPSSSTRVHFTSLSLTASWLDELKMSEIVENHYLQLASAMKNPEVIKAWFRLPIDLFMAIDFMRPIYVSEFKAFYYLNKINQYKLHTKTQLELVRISVLDDFNE